MNPMILTSIPIISGVLITYLASRLDRSRYQVRGVVGPYFGALAVLFGLFASLTANEAWQRVSQANATVSVEVDALNGILEFGRLLGKYDELEKLVADYIDEEGRHHVSFRDEQQQNVKTSTTIHSLYAYTLARKNFTDEQVVVQGQLIRLLETIRVARLERQNLLGKDLSETKVLALLILGALTQAAIALCHAGNTRASIASVLLFSVAFSVTVYFITASSHPDVVGHMIDMRHFESVFQ